MSIIQIGYLKILCITASTRLYVALVKFWNNTYYTWDVSEYYLKLHLKFIAPKRIKLSPLNKEDFRDQGYIICFRCIYLLFKKRIIFNNIRNKICNYSVNKMTLILTCSQNIYNIYVITINQLLSICMVLLIDTCKLKYP